MEAVLMGRAHAFERGDRVYITTPVVATSPTTEQVDEFAFASAVKGKAPNENIGWLRGRYVEAERANLNGAMWLSEELALKSLTPMLMPITVMHDPRTAVGTIADCKFFNEAGSTRLENVLAVWRHRFPEVWDEVAENVAKGQLMQSMEAFAPWYTCGDCEAAFVKLPHGAEQASWCDHLRSNSGRRILRDTCFTGTGLIFGSRGGVGAYTEAYLDHFHDEVAEFHERAHIDSTYRPTARSTSLMGMTQIEESELAQLRRERDENRRLADERASENRELTTRVERVEAEKVQAEQRAQTEKARADGLEEKAQRATLKDARISQLGAGFMAKLGDFSKARLTELAGKVSDEEWDAALKEREEIAGVQRNAAAEGGATPPASDGSGEAFQATEVASFLSRTGAAQPNGANVPDGATSIRQLARTFGKRPAAPAGK